MKEKSKEVLVKNDGQVFTPTFLVRNILDFAGYSGNSILQKHIIDNSCGAGAFLTEIVRRYCTVAISNSISKEEIKKHLETYIHGIELEDVAYANCINNLNAIVEDFDITNVNWDVIHEDALSVTKHDGKMNFVVGNPPYVRVHNLNDSYDKVKNFAFANGGMTDLYLVFYELGLRMLAKSGHLCYIAPSSWLSSLAGSNMRQYIKRNKNLLGVIDLEHFQPFNATAYTLIALFQNGANRSEFDYYKYNGNTYSYDYVCAIPYSKVEIDSSFYLANTQRLAELQSIKCDKVTKHASVKNGFATLADKVFIGDVPETFITIPIIKASTGKWYRGLYPYDHTGKPLPKTTLFADKAISEHFEKNKDLLLKGRKDNGDWFYYGRTQALKDVSKAKIAINTIIKDIESIKLNYVAPGSGVYSGLYILTDVPFETIESIIKTEDFIQYISTLKCYKSGGYYTFNSKDLEQYINNKLNKIGYEGTNSTNSTNQSGIFEGCLELFP